MDLADFGTFFDFFFIIASFILLQKNGFWQNKYLNSIQGFKSAILAIFHFWQNGSFEPLHEIQKMFLPIAFFWSIMKLLIVKIFRKCPRVHQIHNHRGNVDAMSIIKVSQRTKRGFFLKKPSRDLKNYFCFGWVWIPQTPGRVNWKWLVFLPPKSMYRQCDSSSMTSSSSA